MVSAERSLAAAVRAPARRRVATAVACLALLVVAACSSEKTVYDALFLAIKSTAPSAGQVIARLDLAIIKHDADGQVVVKLPRAGEEDLFAFPLPAGTQIVADPYVIRIAQGPLASGVLQLRVRALADDFSVLTTWSGTINTATKDRFDILLTGPAADCDADGDGVRNCNVDGCCGAGEASDCVDLPGAGTQASPFDNEDPCLDCGNGIDEDCDGADIACVDADKDGVADCQEASCGPSGVADAEVYPGAPELCDGKDNDCDGKVDEGLSYVDIDGKSGALSKGDACGTGACKGGKAVCSPDGKSLVCSSADKKADVDACDNDIDDDCDGKINGGCAPDDFDGDGVSNKAEDEDCTFAYARYHSEFHTGAKETCCVAYAQAILAVHPDWKDPSSLPSDVKNPTTDLLAQCDRNCDGAITPCHADDKDGDGQKAPLDCDDTDPLTYQDAAEKCGDGKVQSCFGADPACSSDYDKDGDGWPAGAAGTGADCDDADQAIHPEADELCDGVDNNCDGVIDDGAPEAGDAVCGDTDGECAAQSGISACKHYTGDNIPGALDCLGKTYDAASLTCVGCVGDKRPETDLCDYLDNDCDGTADEDYGYAQHDGKVLAVEDTCDGVGECGLGKVECNQNLDKAVCSTDPNGSGKQNKAEVCDNKDNNCDGKTDETLTSIADAACQKKGVCSGEGLAVIETVCVAGNWVCDYGSVASFEFAADESCVPGTPMCHCKGLGKQCFAMQEMTCDGLDNDCDGDTDDDFNFDDLGTQRLIGDPCGTGVCGGGKVVCGADKKGLNCDTLFKVTKETCDGKDNDCNAKTDEGLTVADSNCLLVGVCTADNVVATCPAGKWICEYAAVGGYEAGKELVCDGKDNDCDGKTDEDFDYSDLGKARKIGDVCGTGACGGGVIICKEDNSGLICTTDSSTGGEACDGKDNDCDGKTDETFAYLESVTGKSLAVGAACDGIGVCGGGAVECLPSQFGVTCSSDPNGSKPEALGEKCDDKDNDCDGDTDEGCNVDKDGYCTDKMVTEGKPAACTKGGGDCQDGNANINPGRPEICNGVDEDCNSKTDETFFWDSLDESTGKTTPLGIGTLCGLGACAGGNVLCTEDGKAATCSTIVKLATESCNDLDDDCDGLTDEGCDDDGDDWCDATMVMSGTPKVCPKGGNDCNDDPKAGGADVHPTQAEACNDIDDGCNGKTDEGCDDDNDGWCDADIPLVGTPNVCLKGGNDCNDDPAKGGAGIHPTAAEICDDIDQDCNKQIDEGCDDDKDGWCDGSIDVVGSPKICTKGKNDCNDEVADIHPNATELCNDIDDNCASATDEGCDDDGDDWCDVGMVLAGSSKACPKGGNDCNDDPKAGGAAIHPTAAEICDDIDQDCNGAVDEGCDDDKDGWCDAKINVVGSPKICSKGKDDYNDEVDTIHPTAT